MNIRTNQLWVVQEMYVFDVQFNTRKRRGKLFFVYDYRSSFIFCAQFYFVGSVMQRKKQLIQILGSFGIPEFILLLGKPMNQQLSKELEFNLGIITFAEENNLYKDKNNRIEEEWRLALECIKNKHYKDINEFYREIQYWVYIWNQSDGVERLGTAPMKQYYQGIQEHVYMEKQTLTECCLCKCQQTVSVSGTIQVLHRIYKVPAKYAGETITFWVSPIEEKEIYIYDENRNRLLYRCPIMKQLDYPYIN